MVQLFAFYTVQTSGLAYINVCRSPVVSPDFKTGSFQMRSDDARQTRSYHCEELVCHILNRVRTVAGTKLRAFDVRIQDHGLLTKIISPLLSVFVSVESRTTASSAPQHPDTSRPSWHIRHGICRPPVEQVSKVRELAAIRFREFVYYCIGEK